MKSSALQKESFLSEEAKLHLLIGGHCTAVKMLHLEREAKGHIVLMRQVTPVKSAKQSKAIKGKLRISVGSCKTTSAH